MRGACSQLPQDPALTTYTCLWLPSEEKLPWPDTAALPGKHGNAICLHQHCSDTAAGGPGRNCLGLAVQGGRCPSATVCLSSEGAWQSMTCNRGYLCVRGFKPREHRATASLCSHALRFCFPLCPVTELHRVLATYWEVVPPPTDVALWLKGGVRTFAPWSCSWVICGVMLSRQGGTETQTLWGWVEEVVRAAVTN